MAALGAASVACFDKRWDGKAQRCLLGVCFPATQTLLIYRLSLQADQTMSATLEARLQAISITSMLATRTSVSDLLVVKPRGTLALLTHGVLELPLHLNEDTDDDIRMDVDTFGEDRTHPRVLSVDNPVLHSANLVFSNGVTFRTTIDLIPKDSLTRQCLAMLAMALPRDTAFNIHALFLFKWSRTGFATSDDVAFNAFSDSIYEIFGIESASASAGLSGEDTHHPWCKLARTASATRFREDPVLKKLRLPHHSAPLVSNSRPTSKPHPLLAPLLNSLHHIAEDMRLTIIRYHSLLRLVPLICRVAMVIRPEWADYWKRLCPDAMAEWPSPAKIGRCSYSPFAIISMLINCLALEYVDDRLPIWPPDMAAILYGRINNPEWSPPWAEPEHFASQFKLVSSFAFGQATPLPYINRIKSAYSALADNKTADTRDRAENALQCLVKNRRVLGLTPNLPLGIAAPLREAARTCQLLPSGDWSVIAYELIGRNDLAEGVNSTINTVTTQGYRPVKEFVVCAIF